MPLVTCINKETWIIKRDKTMYSGGNSCFFNSVHQMIFHIVEFREFLIFNKQFFDDNIILNLINLFEKLKTICITPTTFLHNMTLNQYYTAIQKKFFMDPVDKAIATFNSNQKLTATERAKKIADVIGNKETTTSQRDPTELYNKYVNFLLEELTKKLLIYSDQTDKVNMYYFYLKLNIPILNHFRQESITECPIDDQNKENFPFIIYENTYDITLIDPTNTDPININIIIPDEIIEYRCPSGNTQDPNINVTRKLYNIPNNYFIISIKRFFGEIKLENPININLNQPVYLEDINKNKYQLIGTICHAGSQFGGHVWYHHLYDNIWNTYDDSSHSIGIPNTKNMYVLLFRKITLPTNHINIYSLNYYNKLILDNMILYQFDHINDRFKKIKEYILILSFYTDIINNKKYTEFNDLILNCILEYKQRINKLIAII
jgi:hypothetical protein